MDYQSVVSFTQSFALIFFIILFVLVVGYVFWPGNAEKFDRAAQSPLEPDGADSKRKG